MAQGSDEMLMTLLAGQAAVDCAPFGVASWEDVEGWKKVCLSFWDVVVSLTPQELTVLTTRLESLNARYQRETKILTAARTLQKLNNTNKRMSKQTTEHLEQAEKRADTAERVCLS
jgi:hypothetical protein